MTLQDVVRAQPWVTWRPGRSKLYKDKWYTKTKCTVRFNFCHIEVDLAGQVVRGDDETPREQQLRQALVDAGFDVKHVVVTCAGIMVYQEFPVAVIELPAKGE